MSKSAIATEWIQLQASADGLTDSIGKAMASAGTSSGKTYGSSFTHALGTGFGTAAKIGAASLGAAGVAMGKFASDSVKAGMDFDSSMSQVAATMGKTMDEMQNEVGSVTLKLNGQTKEFTGTLREFAQEMGKNTAFSATQAADALNYMALAGYDTQTSMEMLPNVLNLAAAGNMDLARASDMVTDASTAFGLSVDENGPRITQMVDEMAKAASTGNTSVEQLGDAFLVVGGLAQELNGGMVELSDGTSASVDGVQELEIALTAMANAGVKGSEAGTHMRNMLLKLSSPTAEGAKQMEALGVSVFDAEGQMRSLADIFGDLSGSLGDLTQEEKIQAISDLFNTRDLASAEALLNAVNQDWDAIGESILDADGAAQQMADTQLDNLAGDITLFQSALEGTKIAISDTLSPALREFVQLGTSGLSDLTTAFNENGITGAAEVFGDWLSDALALLIEMLPDVVQAGMDILISLVQGISDNHEMIVEAALGVVETLVNGIAELLPLIDSTATELILALADGIASYLPELIPTVVNVVLTIVDHLMENLPMIIQAGIEIIIALVEGIIKALPDLIYMSNEITVEFTAAMIELLPQILELGIGIVLAIVEGFIQTIPEFIERAPEMIESLVQTLSDNSDQLDEAGSQLMAGLWDGIKSSFSDLLTKIPNLATQMTNKFKGAFGIHSPSTVFRDDIGFYLGEGVGEGWDDAMDDVTNRMMSDLDIDVPAPNVSQMTRDLASSSTISQGQLASDDSPINITIPVYIGQKRVETIVLDAQNIANYISGGR